MSQSLPVCRVGKIHHSGKSTPQTVMGHLARTRATLNADPKRLTDNIWLIGEPRMDLVQTIRAHLVESGIKPRSNAVIACDIVLSISHTFFTPKGDPESDILDARKVHAFQHIAFSFVKERFGSRLVAAVLHLDEYTPHLQVVLVPLIVPEQPDQKARLSARELFSRENLVALQQAWEDALQPFGVGRRTKRSAVHHVDAQQYGGCIAAIQRVDPTMEVRIQLPAPKRLESAHAYVVRAKSWKAEEEQRLKRSIRPLLGLALEGKLTRRSAHDGTKLRRQLREANKTQADVRAHANRLRIELDQCSPPSASAIAGALDLTWLDANMSPIAAVMRHKRIGRTHALHFLAKTFGSEAAANILREEVILSFRHLDFDRVADTRHVPATKADPAAPGI